MMAKKHLGQVRLTSWRMAPCTTTAWAFIDWLSPKSYVLPKHFFFKAKPRHSPLYEILVLGQLRGRVSSKLSLSSKWHSLGTNQQHSWKTDGQITKPTSTNYLLWMLRIHLSSQWKKNRRILKALKSQKIVKEFFCSTVAWISLTIFQNLNIFDPLIQ